ncbi:MAG: iron-sulfur cluster repair di-iron protein [Pirellulales bacterium]
MRPLTAEMIVGDCVAVYPATARVFETYGIDYCCGGGQPLHAASADAHVSLDGLMAELKKAVESSLTAEPTQEVRWIDASLAVLCQHIIANHHNYLRRELPRLSTLISKVLDAHGSKHPELVDLAEAFDALCKELRPHMMKEEQILFPAIASLERSVSLPSFPFGTVASPIQVMEQEHRHAGDELASIRSITQGFSPPPDACPTYLAMLQSLKELEANMHQHVHKENNILFPRAIELEGCLREAAAG